LPKVLLQLKWILCQSKHYVKFLKKKFKKFQRPVKIFFKAAPTAGIGLPLPTADDLEQMKKKA